MSPLKVVDKLRDQAEQLLGVLIRSLAESDLEGRKKRKLASVGLESWVCSDQHRFALTPELLPLRSERRGNIITSFLPLAPRVVDMNAGARVGGKVTR